MLKPDSLPALRPAQPDEFLPPVSRWTSWGGMVLLATVGAAIALAAVVRYGVTVRAVGSVRPVSGVQIVQAKTAASIASIQVQPNQPVQQGDVIVQLDRTRLDTERQQLQATLAQHQQKLAQINAQIELLESEMAIQAQTVQQSIATAQTQLAQTQQQQRQQQITDQAEVTAAQAALDLAESEMQRYQRLVDSGAVSQLQLEEKQAALRTATAQLQRARAAANAGSASVTLAQQQINQAELAGAATLAQLQREQSVLIQQRLELQTQQIQEQKALQQIEADLQNSVIRATSDGTILRLNVRNADQVVQPGDIIAEIAPNQQPLQIQAWVAPQDINQVRVGQAAQIQITACPYTDYGLLRGTVTAVAADATRPSATSETTLETAATAYEITIQPETTSLYRRASGSTATTPMDQVDQACPLQAGMDAEAQIISRQESLLAFLLRQARLLVR